MGINCKGSQGQTERAVALQEEEEAEEEAEEEEEGGEEGEEEDEEEEEEEEVGGEEDEEEGEGGEEEEEGGGGEEEDEEEEGEEEDDEGEGAGGGGGGGEEEEEEKKKKKKKKKNIYNPLRPGQQLKFNPPPQGNKGLKHQEEWPLKTPPTASKNQSSQNDCLLNSLSRKAKYCHWGQCNRQALKGLERCVCVSTPKVRRACCPQGHDTARDAKGTQHTLQEPLQFLLFEQFSQKGTTLRDPAA